MLNPGKLANLSNIPNQTYDDNFLPGFESYIEQAINTKQVEKTLLSQVTSFKAGKLSHSGLHLAVIQIIRLCKS
jgi:hypothetical protein